MIRIWTWCRARPWTWAAVAGVSLGAVGYGVGRYAAPTKVEERERVVERLVTDEKAVAKAVTEARTTWEREVKDNTRIETRYVDGKPSVRIEYRDRDSTSSGGKVETKVVEVVVEKRVEVEKVVEKERIVTRDAPRWTLGATAGTGWTGGAPQPIAFGGILGFRFAGPFGAVLQAEGSPVGFSGRAGLTLQF
jgi:hypothetical protein